MGKKVDIGVDNIARKVKKAWIGVDNKARKIKKMWIGDDNGKARLFFSGGGKFIGIATRAFSPPGNSSASTQGSALYIGSHEKVETVMAAKYGESLTYTALVYGDGKLLLLTTSGIYYYSTDGYTWTQASNTNFKTNSHPYPPLGACYFKGKFWVYRYSTAYYSTDLVNWSSTSLTGAATFGYLRRIISINGYLIANTSNTTDANTTTTAIRYSKDGINWTHFSNSSNVLGIFPLGVDDSGTTWFATMRNTDYSSSNHYGYLYAHGITTSGSVAFGQYFGQYCTTGYISDMRGAAGNGKCIVRAVYTEHKFRITSALADNSWSFADSSAFEVVDLYETGIVNHTSSIESIGFCDGMFIILYLSRVAGTTHLVYSSDGVSWTLGGPIDPTIVDGSGDGTTKYVRASDSFIDISDL